MTIVSTTSTSSPSSPAPTEALRRAVDELRAAIADNLERNQVILTRLEELETGLRDGASAGDLAAAEPTPGVAEMLSQNLAALETAGSTFQTAQARALHADGLTMDAIAERFGVTRQRVSALLRNAERSG